jgi:signal transduction histidine kinase
MVTARHMARGLSTLELGQSGLSASIAHWLGSLNHLMPFQVRYESPQGWGLKEPGMAIHIYRIIQEAVQNAIKHSHGDQITVRLIPRDHELWLSIEDNGVGMAEGAATHSRGLGMKTMRHRSSLLHAQLLFEANAHGGLTVSCKIPFSIQLESQEPDS